MSKPWRNKCLKNPDMMFKDSFRKAKNRAKKKGIPFKITLQSIMKLFEAQGGKCFYSGIKLNIVKENPDQLHDPFKMTLDCIDYKLGYIEDNVVWCAYCVNSMKQKMNIQELVMVCSAVADFSKKRA